MLNYKQFVRMLLLLARDAFRKGYKPSDGWLLLEITTETVLIDRFHWQNL